MDVPLTVERLAPAHDEHFFRLFDTPARCSAATAACCCHFCHVDDAIAWNDLDGSANRTAMRARIGCGEMDGYLAFAGEEVVGWINTQPRHKFAHPDARTGIAVPPTGVPAHASAMVACIVVARGWQDRDVERALLDAALLDLRARGLRFVDAFPAASGDAGPHDGATRGALDLFIAAGFAPIARNLDVVVARRRLSPP